METKEFQALLDRLDLMVKALNDQTLALRDVQTSLQNLQIISTITPLWP